MSEPEPAFLLPGLDGTGELFADFMAAAPPSFKCSIISYPVDRKLSYRDLEDQVARALPSNRPFLLIAESFSGPLAARLAARSDFHVTAVVLANSFVRHPLPRFLRYLARPALFRFTPPRFVLAWLMLSPFAKPALTLALHAALRKVLADVVAYRVRLVVECEESAALRLVRAPLLYLRGTHDRLIPQKTISDLLTVAPSMVVRRIDAAHAILQTAPAECWSAIVEFLGDR